MCSLLLNSDSIMLIVFYSICLHLSLILFHFPERAGGFAKLFVGSVPRTATDEDVSFIRMNSFRCSLNSNFVYNVYDFMKCSS